MNNGNSTATLAELQDYNNTLLKQVLADKLNTVQYMSHIFNTDNNNTHVILMNGQFADLSISGGFTWPGNFTWKDISGNDVTMSAIQAVQFSTTLFSYTQLCYNAYNIHLTNNNALIDISTAQTYDITTGWPVYGVDYNDVTASTLYQNSRRPQVNTIDGGSNTSAQCNSSSTTYIVMRRFSFRGTANTGTPTAIKAVCYISQSSYTGRIRIQDITNGVTVCESATFNNTIAAIINLGTISNLSTGESIWEVQIKSSSVASTTNMNSVNIYF